MLTPSPEFLRDMADRCDNAAVDAKADGDYAHAEALMARARDYRRQAREAKAGITTRTWTE